MYVRIYIYIFIIIPGLIPGWRRIKQVRFRIVFVRCAVNQQGPSVALESRQFFTPLFLSEDEAIRMLHMFRTVWRLVYGLLTSGNAMLSTFFILLLTLYIYACLGGGWPCMVNGSPQTNPRSADHQLIIN